ncbi:MAG TPA: glycosyltransferase family 39 protein [Bacteroidales bacterium]|nr:glycosyltransferase family 39 protein [Bacteroidales bacterium]
MTLFKNKSLTYQLIIAVIAGLLFIPFLGGVHLFDWDEINFAESAREMIATGDYLTVRINYLPFWEKPPLFIWMQVLSMKIFGVNEFAARFPDAVCGIVTLLVLFNIGKKLYDERMGLIWVLVYAGSILPFVYFKSGIIDPWFNLFIFLGIWFFILYQDTFSNFSRKWAVVLSALFIGLGILTKGPVALLIFLITAGVFWFVNHFRFRFSFTDLLLFLGVLILSGGFWFILQILNGNFHIILDFIEYQVRLFNTQDAGHGGFLFYHFVVLFFGVFPASVFALVGFRKDPSENPSQKMFHRWMVILFWVVLILFTIVRTKIVHYSSLCYFPLTFLAARVIYQIVTKRRRYPGWFTPFIITIGVLYAILVGSLQFVDTFKQRIIDSGMIHDQFAVGNLQHNADWTGAEFIIGLLLLAGLVTFLILLRNGKTGRAIITVFTSVLLFTFLTVVYVAPRIEGYSQRAAIEFYQSLQGKDFYIGTLGFKSYAQYFYTRKPKPENANAYQNEWLMSGDIDKNAYFVTKINKKDRFLKQYPQLEELYVKNGFVFLVRRSEK